MGIANIGIPGLILVVVLALIIFGPKKLPEIGKAAGDTLKVFKSSVKETSEETDEISDEKNDNNK